MRFLSLYAEACDAWRTVPGCFWLSNSIQFEQIDRVEPPDLEPVGVADAGPVEPICRVIDVLEWPVGREKDAIGADLEDRINQRLRSEITRVVR